LGREIIYKFLRDVNMNRKRLTLRKAASQRREIPEDFKYNKKKLKHLKHILHNVNVALGTLVSAHNEFSRVKGPDISPDGLLGGLGYVLPVKDIKESLNESIKSLSDVADSLADELTNPHWSAEDDSEVKKLIKEKEEVEEKAEEVQDEDSAPGDDESESEPTEDENEDEPVEPQNKVPHEPPKDTSVTPEDVVTSKEFQKTASNDAFAKLVKESLVRFSSIGKKA
jgi:SMC interacting uncharacterized protein involved in chromosome segregation